MTILPTAPPPSSLLAGLVHFFLRNDDALSGNSTSQWKWDHRNDALVKLNLLWVMSQRIANLMLTAVRVLENASGMRSGTESLPRCFFTTTVSRFHIIFFAFLKKEEMRSGIYFTQQNVFLVFTVVVTKHVWPYFQSRYPKTSSKRVSSRQNTWTDNLRKFIQSNVNFLMRNILCIVFFSLYFYSC